MWAMWRNSMSTSFFSFCLCGEFIDSFCCCCENRHSSVRGAEARVELQNARSGCRCATNHSSDQIAGAAGEGNSKGRVTWQSIHDSVEARSGNAGGGDSRPHYGALATLIPGLRACWGKESSICSPWNLHTQSTRNGGTFLSLKLPKSTNVPLSLYSLIWDFLFVSN